MVPPPPLVLPPPSNGGDPGHPGAGPASPPRPPERNPTAAPGSRGQLVRVVALNGRVANLRVDAALQHP